MPDNKPFDFKDLDKIDGILAEANTYERPCEICGKMSNSHADDYECKYCSIDHNQCCRDEEYDCCKDCAEKFRKEGVPSRATT